MLPPEYGCLVAGPVVCIVLGSSLPASSRSLHFECSKEAWRQQSRAGHNIAEAEQQQSATKHITAGKEACWKKLASLLPQEKFCYG